MSNVNPKFMRTIMPCAFLQINTADLCTDLDNISEVCESITEFFTVFIPRDWLFRIWTNSQATSCMCYIRICNNAHATNVSLK